MQADGRLVQHIAHALQIAAQLRRQPNALRLAPTQGRCAPVQRQITQAHLLQKLQPAPDLRHQIARNIGFALTHAAYALQRLHPLAQVRHTQARQCGDGYTLMRPLCGGGARRDGTGFKPHGAGRCIKSRALAGRAGRIRQILHIGLGKRLLTPLVVLVFHRIIKHLALLLSQAHAGADTVRAPAVLAVVGEQTWIQLGITGAAYRAGTFGGKNAEPAHTRRGRAGQHVRLQFAQFAQYMHHPLAMHQRLRQCGAQLGFVVRRHIQTEHRQLDRVLLEAVDARKTGGRQKVAIYPQMGETARPRPVCQFGVHALAVHHQGAKQADVLAAKGFHQLRRNAVRRLRRHRCAVVDAMLRAQLDKQQAQKVPDLGGGAHRRFAPAPAQPLLDCHRGRNAIHRIHLRAPRRLHDGTGIGVERLQITPLPLVKQNVKRQRRFARTGNAGHHRELAVRDFDAQGLEVVFAGVDDLDAIRPRPHTALSWRIRVRAHCGSFCLYRGVIASQARQSLLRWHGLLRSSQ